ncbi:MAG: DUF3244 domain-containing protein [Tannerellaceae bacterium]|jgi:hypothetical protein|nr:DUF3244 domain-containing protein [Tannerellaceae bacterium]
MKTKRFLTIVSFTLLLLLLFLVDVKADEEDWRRTGDRSSTNHSVSIAVFIAESDLHIYSVNEWTQVNIQVLDANNTTLYWDEIYLPAEEKITIPLGDIPDGAYQVVLIKYGIPLVWYLIK